jgi:putative DNA primase/helicase
MASLAGLRHLADWAARGGTADTIDLRHAQQGAAWCDDYLESHARRMYSCIVTPQMRAAHDLAEKIKQKTVGADGFFSCRDVYFKDWTGLNTPEAVKKAAEVLLDAGWIRDVPAEPRPGRRPAAMRSIRG